MAKPSPDEVKQIIETDLDDTVLNAYIDDANSIINDVLGGDDKRLTKWLAAHLLACTRERQSRYVAAQSAQARFTGSTGMGLDATHYGQTVKTMDTSGKLESALGKQKVSLTAVKEPNWRDKWPTRWWTR